jgi:stage II sporulation protein D
MIPDYKKPKTIFQFEAVKRCGCCGFLISSKKFWPVLITITSIFLSVLLWSGCSKKDSSALPPADQQQDSSIRVLLLKNINKISLKGSSSWSIRQDSDSQSSILAAEAGKPMEISISNGTFSLSQRKFNCTRLTMSPQNPFIFNLNGNSFRGNLSLIASQDGSAFDAVNIVGIETYLAGVVGAEMPSYWESSALEAQAICSRTYCLYIKRNFGKDRTWDVTATQANQVYSGIRSETQSVRKAVSRTKGMVLVCEQSGGHKEIFPAYFCSSCGGFTENSQNIFGGDFFEPLKGVQCPYCQLAAKEFFWQNLLLDKSEISLKLIKRYPVLETLETIAQIIPSKESVFEIKTANEISTLSRLTFIKLVGSNGQTSFLKAEDFRLSIDPTGAIFKSTVCKITDANDKLLITDGRGYGHGCGLCQCGAQALARFYKKDASQILFYYFPNSSIEKLQ